MYDTKFLNEQGFLSEHLHFNNIVGRDTQEILFDECGANPQDYKDEMLTIMEECKSRLTKNKDKEEAELYCKKNR